MGIKDICPFYGKNDDYCDVGCEYISPHDVNMIIRFCNGRHKQCNKYLELADRFQSELPNAEVLKPLVTTGMEGESDAVQTNSGSRWFSSVPGSDRMHAVSCNHDNKGEKR